jgi:hypothetical protein
MYATPLFTLLLGLQPAPDIPAATTFAPVRAELRTNEEGLEILAYDEHDEVVGALVATPTTITFASMQTSTMATPLSRSPLVQMSPRRICNPTWLPTSSLPASPRCSSLSQTWRYPRRILSLRRRIRTA